MKGQIIVTHANKQRFCAADLYDAHHMQLRVSTLQFRSFGQRGSFWGQAETLRTFEDHSPVLAAVSEPGDGKVLVVDAGGSLRVGVMGDNLAAEAARNGWAGVVINGAIRDSVGIGGIDIGVKALGATARRGWNPSKGFRSCPVEIGNITVEPGEWVYCDEDAVMVSADFLEPGDIPPPTPE